MKKPSFKETITKTYKLINKMDDNVFLFHKFCFVLLSGVFICSIRSERQQWNSADAVRIPVCYTYFFSQHFGNHAADVYGCGTVFTALS